MASCSERAYRSLPAADAARMLMMSDEAELAQYAAEVGSGCLGRGWADDLAVFASRETSIRPGPGSRMCCAAAAAGSGWQLATAHPRCPPPCAWQRGWELAGGRVVFCGGGSEGPAAAAMEEDGRAARAAGAAAGGPLAAQDLIQHCLAYAKELERIV